MEEIRAQFELAGFSPAEARALASALRGDHAGDNGSAVRLLLVREDERGLWRDVVAGAQGLAIVLAETPTRERLEEAIGLGACGYLALRSFLNRTARLRETLDSAAGGQFVCDEQLLRSLVDSV